MNKEKPVFENKSGTHCMYDEDGCNCNYLKLRLLKSIKLESLLLWKKNHEISKINHYLEKKEYLDNHWCNARTPLSITPRVGCTQPLVIECPHKTR